MPCIDDTRIFQEKHEKAKHFKKVSSKSRLNEKNEPVFKTCKVNPFDSQHFKKLNVSYKNVEPTFDFIQQAYSDNIRQQTKRKIGNVNVKVQQAKQIANGTCDKAEVCKKGLRNVPSTLRLAGSYSSVRSSTPRRETKTTRYLSCSPSPKPKTASKRLNAEIYKRSHKFEQSKRQSLARGTFIPYAKSGSFNNNITNIRQNNVNQNKLLQQCISASGYSKELPIHSQKALSPKYANMKKQDSTNSDISGYVKIGENIYMSKNAAESKTAFSLDSKEQSTLCDQNNACLPAKNKTDPLQNKDPLRIISIPSIDPNGDGRNRLYPKNDDCHKRPSPQSSTLSCYGCEEENLTKDDSTLNSLVLKVSWSFVFPICYIDKTINYVRIYVGIYLWRCLNQLRNTKPIYVRFSSKERYSSKE